MKILENLNLSGQLFVDVFKEGNLSFSYKSPNTIVNSGKELICKLLVGNDQPNKVINRYGVGNSTIDTSSDMIDLQGSTLFKGSIYDYTFPAYNQVKINFQVEASQANGLYVKEFGLFSSDGTLFNRVVWDGTLLKTEHFVLSCYFLITHN